MRRQWNVTNAWPRSLGVNQAPDDSGARIKCRSGFHIQVELPLMRWIGTTRFELDNHERPIVFLNDAVNRAAEDDRPVFAARHHRKRNLMYHSAGRKEAGDILARG